MRPHIINDTFISIDSSRGTELIPYEYFNFDDHAQEMLNAYDYVNLELVRGWFGRLSAPGYMDCTDWSGPFDSEEEALESIKELYGDDEDESDYEDEAAKEVSRNV